MSRVYKLTKRLAKGKARLVLEGWDKTSGNAPRVVKDLAQPTKIITGRSRRQQPGRLGSFHSPTIPVPPPLRCPRNSHPPAQWIGAPQTPQKGALPPSEPPAGAFRAPCAPLRSGKSDLWNHMLAGLVPDFEKALRGRFSRFQSQGLRQVQAPAASRASPEKRTASPTSIPCSWSCPALTSTM